VKDWFQFYAREWDVPCIGIETPRSIGAVDETIVQAIAKKTEALIEPLEAVCGQKFDIDKLREVVGLSKECTRLWKAVLQTAATVPTPLTFFDGTVQMGPAVVLRGTQGAVDYYEMLLAELQQRITDGVAAIEGEKHRIYWEGMPIWGKLRDLSTQFMELQTAVVASTYCNSWVYEDLDPADPFVGMARAYSELFICRSDDYKEKYMLEMIEKFSIDGVVYHDAKTCPNNSNNRYDLPKRLETKTGKPFVVINGDLNDMRLYSDEQSRTNIEAFVEQLAGA
jgi:benzoyl-CoA reductase/2-hydroxyglutaryl-CoA dehydratase subunit BcrC/BadD/HgdB